MLKNRWLLKLFLGLLLFIFILIIGLALYNYYLAPRPYDVQVTNISSNSLVISWQTDRPARGGVVVSKSLRPFWANLNFFNAKFWPGSVGKYADQLNTQEHYVYVTGLSPDRAYYYRIYSNGRYFKYDNEKQVIPNLKTQPAIESIPQPELVFGQVYDSAASQPANQALVYLSLVADGQTETYPGLAAITSDSGIWTADLSLLSKDQTQRYLVEAEVVKTGQNAQAAVLYESNLVFPIIYLNPQTSQDVPEGFDSSQPASWFVAGETEEGGCTFTLSVVDLSIGRGLSGVQVFNQDPCTGEFKTYTTNAYGQLNFDLTCSEGMFNVTLGKSGYQPTSISHQLVCGGTLGVNLLPEGEQ